jgi:hypothetical protein
MQKKGIQTHTPLIGTSTKAIRTPFSETPCPYYLHVHYDEITGLVSTLVSLN